MKLKCGNYNFLREPKPEDFMNDINFKLNYYFTLERYVKMYESEKMVCQEINKQTKKWGF